MRAAIVVGIYVVMLTIPLFFIGVIVKLLIGVLTMT